jgi:glycosyltransferase involved in cell wall biosynthesis
MADPSTADVLMLIPNLDFGGAQRVFHDHGRMLAERYRVAEVVFNLELGQAYPSGNRLISLDVPGGGGTLSKLRHFHRRIAALRRVKAETNARLCISHLTGADYVNLLSAGKAKTVLVVHGSKLHDRTESGWKARVQLRWMLPRLYRRADRIVTVSTGIADELVSLGVERRRIRTIHNFFEPSSIRERAAEPLSAAEQAMFDGDPVIVASGRLHPQKNHAGLLEAFARLLKRRRARLVIVGEGPLRAALLVQARSLGLDCWDVWSGAAPSARANCCFVGFQDNPFRYLAQATVFALPSSWEGMPMVLGEAMACGLPIVSSDCPTGPREFLAPESIAPEVPLVKVEKGANGWLLPLLDGTVDREQALECWAEAMAALLDDGPEQERLRGRSLVRAEDFSRERIAPQWFALVEELLSDTVPG